ncbi:hypothetical protein BDR05DRAFT_832993, partial [Suillus weaverae]
LKEQLPTWQHIGAPPKTYHKNKNLCLQQTHNAKLVKDLRDIMRRLTNQDAHQQQDLCPCNDCTNDRLKGCKNPHKCTTIGEKILHNLLPKYNPYSAPRRDDLTLTHRRLEKNAQAK